MANKNWSPFHVPIYSIYYSKNIEWIGEEYITNNVKKFDEGEYYSIMIEVGRLIGTLQLLHEP